MIHLRTQRRPIKASVAATGLVLLSAFAIKDTAEAQAQAPKDAFRQLEEILPTPNAFRAASGAPAGDYWQQQANYEIDVELDDENQRIIGSERITYTNFSPDDLGYLWVQLDANLFAPDSDAVLTATAPKMDRLTYRFLESTLERQTFDGSVTIKKVHDANDEPLRHTIVKTMMRIDLPRKLVSGESTEVQIEWEYHINQSRLVRGRTGYEYFEEDDNYLYEVAQWFPRMAAYTDVNGWQHKQFLGSGEFTLELGNYEARITVPSDHIVAATGELQNPGEVLSSEQRARLDQARTADKPIFIVTPDEARANQSAKEDGKKTWIFKAENVRDFAFASSRKFIWDAQGHRPNGRGEIVMAMSFYPNEGEPLWSRYSTHAIIHTLDVYSRYTFDYPYPVAISVNGPVGGMEYPMICFNGPRPEKDGTYSKRTKYGLISVIIHEVGHNYFPMIVNSDERQWTWMDEGINSFLQFLAEQEWEEHYPSRRGEPQNIVEYMSKPELSPIMTNSESVLALGPNAYSKPATALNILRETVLGRELFDFAFKEYSKRWKFRRPMPADFFRTMEDASGVDLDWFWRGWFYGVDAVDIAITGVTEIALESLDPETEKSHQREIREAEPVTLSEELSRELPKRVDQFPELSDFYNEYDDLDVTTSDQTKFQETVADLDERERKLLSTNKVFTVVDFENQGGLIMPLILDLEFEDGTHEQMRIPAEIWRRNPERVSKLLITDKSIRRVRQDPRLETADIDTADNVFPPEPAKSKFQLFKEDKVKNPMQEAAPSDPKTEGEHEVP